MADMTPLRSIDNGTAADALDVDFNFDTIQSYVNAQLIKRDGTVTMAAALAMGTNKITGLAPATAAADVPRMDQVALVDCVTLGVNTTITTGGVTVATLTVNSPAAGIAFIYLVGDVTVAGVTFNSGIVGIRLTATGTTMLQPGAGSNSMTTNINSTDAFYSTAHQNIVTLAQGVNTIGLIMTRFNIDLGGGAPTGGTVVANSGYVVGIMGVA